jgi:hypothetical protein
VFETSQARQAGGTSATSQCHPAHSAAAAWQCHAMEYSIDGMYCTVADAHQHTFSTDHILKIQAPVAGLGLELGKLKADIYLLIYTEPFNPVPPGV